MDLAQLKDVLQGEASAVEDLLAVLQDELEAYQDVSWRQLLGVVKRVVDAAKAGVLPAHAHSVRIVQEASWEKLHLGYWKDVSVVWRDLYALACLLIGSLVLAGHISPPANSSKAAAAAAAAASSAGASGPPAEAGSAANTGDKGPAVAAGHLADEEGCVMKDGAGPATGRVNDAIRMCDLAVMMGGPAFQHLLHAAIKGLEERLAQEQPGAPQAGEGVGAGAAPPAKRARVSVDAPATNREAAAAAGQGQEEQEGQAVGSDGGATASAACDGSGSPAGLSHHHKSGWATQRAAGGVRLPPGSLVDGPLASRPPVLHVPPLETFLQECMAAPGGGRPTIITGAMDGWPAMERWQDMGYLMDVAGHRTVPIEVGEHYLAEEWGQQLMTVADFIKQHIAPAVNPQPQHDREATVLAAGTARGGDSGSNGGAAGVSDNGRGEAAGDDSSPAARMLEGGGNQAQEGKAVAQDAATSGHVVRRGYLAQHALFEQIPALAADIRTPEYCVLGKDEEEGGGVQAVNAWFGPPGTVTPLHTDPKHNLLCQVVGSKYVRLYSPVYTPNMYPFQEGMNTNSSQVTDLAAVDHAEFPLFAQAPYIDCVLSEGQMLYIPPGWWHAVYSLSVSFSVTFWWC